MPNDATHSFPEENDFDPWGGNLDARCAWKNFGGLSIPEAFELFRSNPIGYEEDFASMGGKAFSYYFTVIDRYIREVAPEDSDVEIEVSGLSAAIWFQLDENGTRFRGALLDAIKELAVHVREEVSAFTASLQEQVRIRREWWRVEKKLAEVRSRQP